MSDGDLVTTRLGDVRPGDVIDGERVTCVLKIDGAAVRVVRGPHAEVCGHVDDTVLVAPRRPAAEPVAPQGRWRRVPVSGPLTHGECVDLMARMGGLIREHVAIPVDRRDNGWLDELDEMSRLYDRYVRWVAEARRNQAATLAERWLGWGASQEQIDAWSSGHAATDRRSVVGQEAAEDQRGASIERDGRDELPALSAVTVEQLEVRVAFRLEPRDGGVAPEIPVNVLVVVGHDDGLLRCGDTGEARPAPVPSPGAGHAGGAA